jgi:hypothetical protein
LALEIIVGTTGGGEEKPDLGIGSAGLRQSFEALAGVARAALSKRLGSVPDQAFRLLSGQLHCDLLLTGVRSAKLGEPIEPFYLRVPLSRRSTPPN